MWFYEVAPTKIVRSGVTAFTYHSLELLHVGQLVTIPVGSKILDGIVIESTKKPTYATKPVMTIIEKNPVPEPLVTLALWLADYYSTPLATVLQTMLPKGLTVKRRQTTGQLEHQTSIRKRTTIVFNTEQQRALAEIDATTSGTVLLQGVTGSGKTEVYKQVVRKTIADGKSAIILVPEIGLTSQVVDEFTQEFTHVLVTHSAISEAQRHYIWRAALYATEPTVVIGPRSALFVPVRDIGVIVVDEAHEPSYKQEQSPRYSALRAASVLGSLWHARVIFGSATPSITDRYIAQTNHSPIVTLTHVARKNAKSTEVSLIDMKQRDNFKKHRFLSDTLLHHIEQNLALKKQTLVFHNRRGSASTTLCENCGWTASCPRCFLPLVLHTDHYKLRCHICGYQEAVPTVCPTCGGSNIIHKGIGTKLIEHELRRLFPNATIARFDGDTEKSDTLHERYGELYNGTIDIAIGTQVVTKGLDLPQLRTVGVIQADAGLALPDFAASERAFQLLAQVVGRVGRDARDTTVVVQSYQPTHPVIQFGITQNYEGFYQYALDERRKAGFPPFRYLLRLTNMYKTEEAAIRHAKSLAEQLRARISRDVEILGPTPAFYERRHATYRWQLVLKSRKRQPLVHALTYVPLTHWQAELDPSSLL